MQITKDMTMIQLLQINPYIEGILGGLGMHCLSCVASQGETLEEALAVHGYGAEDIEDVVAQLNDFVGEGV